MTAPMDPNREELRQLRAGMNMTQSAMARDLGISLRAYQDLEGGSTPVRRTYVLAARYLNLQQADLFGVTAQIPADDRDMVTSLAAHLTAS